MERERPLLNLEQVWSYILETLQVFELGTEHDSRGVYFDFCLSHLKPYTNIGYRESVGERHKSPLKHFTVEKKKQKGHRGISDSYIYLSNSDKLLALAGVHVLTDHQKKSVVDKNIIALRLGLPAKTVAPMLNYCIDCQLMEFGERLSTTGIKYGMYQIRDRRYPGVKLNQHKVFRALREDSLNEMLDEQTRMEFKSLYMGALLVESSRRQRSCSNIMYVGYLHYKEGRDMLFCVDNDSGLLRALVELPSVKKPMDSKPYYRVRHQILDVLFGCLLSVACGPHKRIVNVNIHDMKVFDGWECEIFHMDGEWRQRKPPNGGFRQQMPDMLVAVLYRLLYTLENECEARKDQFWRSVRINKRWEDTVILRYRDTQWSTLDNFPIRRRQFRREPVLMTPSDWEFVKVPELLKKHVGDVSLRCEDHRLKPQTDRTTLAEIPQRRYRDSEHFFNYEFMEEPMDGQKFLEFPNFERLSVTEESLKVLLYIYVFKKVKPIEMQKFSDMELDKKEEIFEGYWDMFQQGSKELITKLTAGRPKFAYKKAPEELLKGIQAHNNISESQNNPGEWGKMLPFVRPPAPILKCTTTETLELEDSGSESAVLGLSEDSNMNVNDDKVQQSDVCQNREVRDDLNGHNTAHQQRDDDVVFDETLQEDEERDEPVPRSPEEMMEPDEPIPRSPEEMIESADEPVNPTPDESDNQPVLRRPDVMVQDRHVPQNPAELRVREASLNLPTSKEMEEVDSESVHQTDVNGGNGTTTREDIRDEPTSTGSPLLSEDDTFSLSLETLKSRSLPGDLKRPTDQPVAEKRSKRRRHQAPRTDIVRKLKGKLKSK
jgi:hypothetical protein